MAGNLSPDGLYHPDNSQQCFAVNTESDDRSRIVDMFAVPHNPSEHTAVEPRQDPAPDDFIEKMHSEPPQPRMLSKSRKEMAI